jgi:DNA modification methylase
MNTSHPTPATGNVFYRAEGLTLYTGDTLTVLRDLQASSVDCVVTSPPPWRQRNDTTTDWSDERTGCPHLNSTPAGYVAALRRVFAQIRQILAPSGTVWINLGDRYAIDSNLLGMPWRVALALQADGWILRNAIVWHQSNAASTPLRDRLACRYQLLFLLVRQPHYFFDLDPIRQPYTGDRPLSRRAHHRGTKPHTATGTWPPPGATIRSRNPGDVWTIPTHPETTDHPTPPPLELLTWCITAGCPPGGTVLDPFSGTATTGLAARRLGRTYIGIDTNPDHHTTALHRLGLTPPDDDLPTHSEERHDPHLEIHRNPVLRLLSLGAGIQSSAVAFDHAIRHGCARALATDTPTRHRAAMGQTAMAIHRLRRPPHRTRQLCRPLDRSPAEQERGMSISCTAASRQRGPTHSGASVSLRPALQSPGPAIPAGSWRTAPMSTETRASAYTGKFRPSTFVTLTRTSYRRARKVGTPVDPDSYSYQRDVQYFATVEPQKRNSPRLHAAMRGSIPHEVIRQVTAATYHQV